MEDKSLYDQFMELYDDKMKKQEAYKERLIGDGFIFIDDPDVIRQNVILPPNDNVVTGKFVVNYSEGARPLTKRKEDAGFDVYPLFNEDYVLIKPHDTMIFNTGVRTAFPSGYYIHLEERGSTGVIGLSQRSGVIDSGYRGEWMIPVTNTNNIPIIISKIPEDELKLDSEFIYYSYSKALCQAVIHSCIHTEFLPVDAETIDHIVSARGTGKLGSSGK